MKIEEIYMRQEVRQMLTEAGINRNTLKVMVKEVLNEELEKACKQAMAEFDVEKNIKTYLQNNADRVLTKTFIEEVRSGVRDKLWDIKISVNLTDESGNLIEKR